MFAVNKGISLLFDQNNNFYGFEFSFSGLGYEYSGVRIATSEYSVFGGTRSSGCDNFVC